METSTHRSPGRAVTRPTTAVLALFITTVMAVPSACASEPVTRAADAPVARSVSPQESAPAPQAPVDSLIAKGRGLLAQGNAAEAQKTFEEAEKLDGSTLKTRMWTLRSWLPQGRVNDSLNEIDKLDRAGQKGPDMDYLYGMAFALKAKGYLQERVPGAVIDMAFTDAVDFLDKATKADPVKYSDAFLPLAEAAWYARNLALARSAADKAVSIAPQDPAAHAMLGQVALAQFRTVNEDESQKAKADAHWEAARAANARSLELLVARSAAGTAVTPEAVTPEKRARLAAAHVELARCYGWKKMTDDIVREYAAAMAVEPAAVDYGEVQSVLGGAGFLAATEAGHKAWAQSAGPDDKGDALLLWWLGYAQLDQKKYAEAEASFQAALAKNPEYSNSSYYVALARFHQQKFGEAIAALQKHFAESPSDLVAILDANRDYSVPILESLVGWAKGREQNLDAAFLTEILVAVMPETARFWNNLGLFYRDAGDVLAPSRKVEDKTKARELWEKALVAYERSVALAPEDPNYLNDLAVVLHYNLGRDLERAKALYAKALVRATEELNRKDLSPGDREVRKIAARDSKDNLEKLTRLMEKEKAKEKEKEKEGAKKDGPQ